MYFFKTDKVVLFCFETNHFHYHSILQCYWKSWEKVLVQLKINFYESFDKL